MSEAPGLLVACLCAQWCGTCRDYVAPFEAQARAQGAAARFVWVDIEDHAEVVGGLDVENFPTLLIAREADDAILFLGTVTPHEQTLQRLVETAARGEFKPLDADAAEDDLDGLVGRVRALGDGANRG